MEKGIELAKGEYIWIAESDDYCCNNFLQIAIGIFNADPLVNLFYSKSEVIDKDGKFVSSLDWWYNDLDANRWHNNYSNDSRSEIHRYLSKKTP